MTYKAKQGDIGLTQIHGTVGRMVRIGQWLNGDGYEDFQHAFVVVEAGRKFRDEMIVEAMPGGAQYVENPHDPERTHWLKCPDQYRSAVATAAVSYEGVPYSALDYVSLAAHRLHIPAPHLRKYIMTSKHMICSQLADAAAENGGWHLFDDGRWPGDVTPLDLNALWNAQRIMSMIDEGK